MQPGRALAVTRARKWHFRGGATGAVARQPSTAHVGDGWHGAGNGARRHQPESLLSRGPHDDDRPQRSNPAVVLIVDAGRDWSPDLLDEVGRQGFLVVHVDDVKRLPLVVGSGSLRAVLIHARSLDVNEVLLLRECRASAPRMSLVVVSSMAAQADVKRALDSSATAFLSLPASPSEVRAALLSGDGRKDNSA